MASLGRCLTGIVVMCVCAVSAWAQEFRGLWVDAWGSGFKTPNEVTQLIREAREGHFNALVVQMRRRGDAFYNNSPHEPKTSDPNVPSGFDPLADLIAKAHNTSQGPRLEVHAWIVAYPLWGSPTTPPSQANHVFNLHPDWFSQTSGGTQYDGSNVNLDPGHPGVQEHLYRVALDIITRYDVDGLNWDYIRYPGRAWGYNPVAVERFNRLYGRSGVPADNDAEWLQFRRDQVSSLVRKVYLSAMAIKPQVKLSADTITWAPGVTTSQSWTNNARAYNDVLQDWRAWMEEGIIDLNIPMAYFDQDGAYVSSWNNWNLFAKEHRYRRHAAIGPALYLNTVANSIAQIRHALAPANNGARADGVCVYSYRVSNSEGRPRSELFMALTQPSLLDPIAPPVFASVVQPPSMPWKTNPSQGHLKGFVAGGLSAGPIDGAQVTLQGPVSATRPTDGTGFFGFVGLPPGTYLVGAVASGLGSSAATVIIEAGQVRHLDLILPVEDLAPPVLSNVGAEAVTDRSATIRWITDELSDSLVEFGLEPELGAARLEPDLTLEHRVSLADLEPDRVYHFRVASTDLAGNSAGSDIFTFRTNPQGVVNDIIIDNIHAVLAGSWSTGSSSTDKYADDYRYKSQGAGSAYVQFTPNILQAGYYDVYAWYPQGNNRPVDAPFLIRFRDSSELVRIDQTNLGGRWNLLGRYLFDRGGAGYVRVTDAFADPGKVVMADAVRFAYRAPPPSPPSIIHQPASLTVLAGQPASLRVTAQGAAPVTYQWWRNANPVPGANENVLSWSSAQAANAGQYVVVISNPAGQISSQPATFYVLEEPVQFDRILPLPNGRVRLILSAQPGPAYVLEYSSDARSWVWLSNFEPVNGSFEYVDASLPGTRFYRARSVP